MFMSVHAHMLTNTVLILLRIMVMLSVLERLLGGP